MSTFIMKVSFRSAKRSDFSFVANCIQELVKIDGSGTKNLDISRMKNTFDNCLNNPKRHPLFIAEDNGRAVGMCLCNYLMTPEMGALTLHVAHLYVKEESRNKGIGSAFVYYVKNYCKENEIKAIEALSPPDSSQKYQERINFFTRHEFDIIGPAFVCPLDEGERHEIINEWKSNRQNITYFNNKINQQIIRKL